MSKRKIIVGVDFSPQSRLAVEVAWNLGRHRHEPLLLVHLAEPLGAIDSSLVAKWEQGAHQRDATLRERLRALQVELPGKGEVESLIVSAEPTEGLATLANERGASLVVVGTHGRTGMQHFLLGSVAERTVRTCEVNVLVVRPGGVSKGGFQRLLVPTDFSENAEIALREALSLAAKNARIEIVHFWQLPFFLVGTMDYPTAIVANISGELRRNARKRGEAIVHEFENHEVHLSFEAVEADAAQGIMDRASEASRHYDAIVMGSRGLRGFRRYLLGSVAEKVVRHAPCSVLVVHTMTPAGLSESSSDAGVQREKNSE